MQKLAVLFQENESESDDARSTRGNYFPVNTNISMFGKSVLEKLFLEHSEEPVEMVSFEEDPNDGLLIQKPARAPPKSGNEKSIFFLFHTFKFALDIHKLADSVRGSTLQLVSAGESIAELVANDPTTVNDSLKVRSPMLFLEYNLPS